ncbi:hypothetical protein ACFLRI_04100 [Bacteroidota bacterium]
MKIKNLVYSLVAIMLVAITFSSCQPPESSASVDQDRIYCVYELFYNQNTDITKARATFRFGNALGTPLFLAKKSEVSCDGELMSKILDEWTLYEAEFVGRKDSATFKWVDVDQNEFNNKIHMVELAYQDSVTVIPRNAAYELFWDGNALIAGESVALFIDAAGNASQTFVVNQLGVQSIILAKNKLELLPEGTATLYMDRFYEIDLQEATSAGGTIFSKYRPENKTVMLK